MSKGLSKLSVINFINTVNALHNEDYCNIHTAGTERHHTHSGGQTIFNLSSRLGPTRYRTDHFVRFDAILYAFDAKRCRHLKPAIDNCLRNVHRQRRASCRRQRPFQVVVFIADGHRCAVVSTITVPGNHQLTTVPNFSADRHFETAQRIGKLRR